MCGMIRKSLIALILVASAFFSCWVAAEDRQVIRNPKRDSPVGVGDIAPDFTLEDHNGRRRTLSAERGKRPVVVVFYRGYW